MERKIIELDQGWDYMQKGITKLKKILEGIPEPQFNSEEYMMLYTYPSVILHVLFKYYCHVCVCSFFYLLRYCCVLWGDLSLIKYRTIYNMCTQKPPNDYSQQLYDKYREAFEEYITSTVRIEEHRDMFTYDFYVLYQLLKWYGFIYFLNLQRIIVLFGCSSIRCCPL